MDLSIERSLKRRGVMVEYAPLLDEEGILVQTPKGPLIIIKNGLPEAREQEDIVANSKTKVYHTPGQHNYRINPANTVHFNSEAEAQAAGYRPSQR